MNNINRCLLITNPSNIFYLTGFPLHECTPGREVFLVLSKKQNLFITDGRLIEFAKQVVAKSFTVIERGHEFPVTDVINTFLQKNKYTTLEYEKADLTILELERFTKALKKIKLVGTENVIENLRLIKNKREIEKIKKSAEITDKTFSSILPLLKPEVAESEIVWKIKTIFNSCGAGAAFEPIVASGSGSAIPHYSSTNKKLKKGEIVLFDFGAKYAGYCSDMTRVVFIGKADTKTRNVYNTVLKAQQKALGLKTKSARKIDEIARDTIIKAGFPSIPHGVGHGVGISIHEDPRLNPKSENKLKKGMVFTVEPGIYLPGWGGVRIEDLLVWEKGGIKNITKSPKKLIEI